MLHAGDIQAAHAFATKCATEIGPVADIGSVSVFHLTDPDGNGLIVYAEN